MHPVVYLPPNPDAPVGEHPLAAAGLADWADGAMVVPIGAGPDGLTGGSLYIWRTPCVTDPSRLEWLSELPSPESPGGRYQIGVLPESPPTEPELRRAYRLPGAEVPVAGGRWVVPDVDGLPAVYVRGADGNWGSRPAARYAEFAAIADGLRRTLVSRERKAVPTAAILDISERALRLNYRLTTELVGRLELLQGRPAAADGGSDRTAEFPVFFAAMGGAPTDA